MQYATSSHCVYYHRYHIVWATKYRYKVLCGDVRLRARDICRQVCGENGVEILHGVLSRDHVHMFVSVPPKLAVADLVRKMKGRSSYKLQREFPELKKRYWGRKFWGRGYFSTTSWNQKCRRAGAEPRRRLPSDSGRSSGGTPLTLTCNM